MSKRFDKKKCKVIPIDAKAYSVAIKIYDEQMKYGWDYTAEQIRSINSKEFQVLAIKHDRDTYAENDYFWKPSIEKPHYHIILRCTDKKKRVRVKQLLDLLGIEFRPGLDDDLWKEHGVETVGNFAGYATYLTHETEDAVADCKELYDIGEIVSNLNVNEIKEVREGYLRVSESTAKVTTKEWVEYDETAYKLGYDFGDFDKWYGNLPFTVRCGMKMRTIRETYERGIRDKVNENLSVLRICIFIQGDHDQGKTYGAREGLKAAFNIKEKDILTVSGGGSGKFDKLQVTTKAIVIDDDVCPNLLNMTDNYICQPYRRNRNNPYWAGEFLIVTSNLNFSDWLENCGIKVYVPRNNNDRVISEHYYAAESRFFICHINQENGENYLALDKPSSRGTEDEQKERLDKFLKFQKKFNEQIADYIPGEKLDYDFAIDPASLPPERAFKAHPEYIADIVEKFVNWFWDPEIKRGGRVGNEKWEGKKSASIEEKRDFITSLSLDSIKNTADCYIYRDILDQISVADIKGALMMAVWDYDFDNEDIGFKYRPRILPPDGGLVSFGDE